MEKYLVMLEKNGKSEGRYKIDKDLFGQIKARIRPFRSKPVEAKAVRCIETGQIFKCASEAQAWVYHQGLTTTMNYEAIKKVCKGIRETMYGYHWEYINKEVKNVLL